jgi:GNAT superfamily N-acetyltransferase
MNDIEIRMVGSESEFKALDELFWEVLWKPIGLPRDIRQSFIIEGEGVDLIALSGAGIIGGLSANWAFPIEVELRHLVVKPEARGNGVGSGLVKKLMELVSQRDCSVLRTISRNTSSDFFKRLGFLPSRAGNVPDHPAFKRHGITFEMFELRFFS